MNTAADDKDDREPELPQKPSQASVSPEFDPAGPPQPVSGNTWFPSLTTMLVTIAAAGTAAYGLLGVSVTQCMGATRSSRLKWEERKQQIDADIEVIRQQPTAPENSVVPQQPNG